MELTSRQCIAMWAQSIVRGRIRSSSMFSVRRLHLTFKMAEQYTFADGMLQTNEGASFSAHEFILAGT